MFTGQFIAKGSLSLPWETTAKIELGDIVLPNGQSAKEAINASYSDALIVIENGKLGSELYFNETTETSRHLLFSITKSVVGMLAGILIEEGSLLRDLPVTHYIPELANSAWGDASVDQVLDMLVSVDFGEDYLDPQGLMEHYRVAMEWNPPGNVDYSGDPHSFLTRIVKGKQEHGHWYPWSVAIR
ncbi:serine hydrolase domain-containing protein [Rhodanobacter aciditrophus]|uniref:Serine hydrolase domain-containing protein n=1 Tax=Rhodanobacter aciditrophus TaxID=1623218 RepID=A0ABW4B4N4_9GAMM